MSWAQHDTEASVTARFADRVRRDPDSPATGGQAPELTYRQLSALAQSYATRLPPLPRGARVVLALDHDAHQIAAALAVLSRGLVLVTLNPGDPSARLREIADAVMPEVVLGDRSHRDAALAAGVRADRLIELPAAAEVALEGPALGEGAARAAPHPGDLAVLICTSGSSGRPKVVMQSHGNLVDNTLRYGGGLGIEPSDRIAWLASLSGGQGMATVFTALTHGARVCPFAIARRGVTGLADWCDAAGITVFDTIPSVLRGFAQTVRDRRLAGIRLVRLASEGAFDGDFDVFCRLFSPEARLASVYASSEAGVIAQGVRGPADRPPPGRLPVGSPAAGIEIALVDADGAPVPDGEAGEIIVTGDHLALGYWGDDALTARRLEVVDGRRRLRSGDMGRRGSDGGLTIVGRVDSQMTVRGHLLQPEEVEAALLAHPDVAAAAVTLLTSPRGDGRLTAYVAPEPGRRPEAEQLRESLRDRLPGHAIPSTIALRESLPFGANGKVDRARLVDAPPLAPPAAAFPAAALPAAALPPAALPDGAAAGGAPAPAPAEVEELLIALWTEALDSEVGRHDPFLDLGGDSLSAAVVAAGVHEALGVELDLRTFSSNLTVAGLAALIERRRSMGGGSELPPLRRAPRSSPLSSAQLRMWDAAELDATRPRWHVVVPFAIRGPLDPDLLRASIAEVVARHEILRTTFTERDGQPVALVHSEMTVALTCRDLRGEDDPEGAVDAATAAELQAPFDLRAGPLLRFALLRVGEQEHRLLRVSHHLVHDALSWRTFFGELTRAYAARREGRPSPLGPEPELQYTDFVHWEREWLTPESDRWRAELAYWHRCLGPPLPPLALPFARSEPVGDGPTGPGVLRWGLAPGDSDALDRLGRQVGATYFMTRLAAFAALLALEGDSEDLVIGTPISTRIRAELQDMIGPFLNFVVLRMRFTGAPTFRGWVGEVRRTVIDAGAHATVPWERLMPELRERGVTIPRVATRFVAWSALSPMRFADLELEPLPRECDEPWGFRLGVNRAFEADRCWVEFDPREHDRDAVRAFLDRLQTLIAVVAAEPDRPLRDLHSAVALA